MPFIDPFLNRITMYRLVLWGLALLAVWGALMSLIGQVAYGWASMLASLAILWVACVCTEYALAKIFRSPTNVESAWITSFILFFTLAPVATAHDGLLVAFAGVLAMASKYFLAVKRKHLFNPAAIALLILSVSGAGLAIWWVGSPSMLPATLVLGLLVVRKIRRFDAVLSFIATALAVASAFSLMQGIALADTFLTLFTSWPLVFFATIMLTEPSTLPPSRPLRIVYGILVGALFSTQFHFGPVYSTPQLALIIGNIYAFFVSSRQKLTLTLQAINQLTPTIFEFVFKPSEKLVFAAGQYLEWTLPHAKPDARGNRRYFTVASSPHEASVRIGARIADAPSTFKRALRSLEVGGTISGGSLAGDFVLPKDKEKKLAFIAGGVGITPFASMIRSLLDTGEKRDIILFYAANTESDFAYRETLEEAKEKLGIRMVYVAGGRLTEETIREHAADLPSRMFYISGPDVMVRAYAKLLRAGGVPLRNVRRDYFPGY